MNHIIFVYGTLRRDEQSHNLLRGAELVAEQAYTTGELWDTGFGYPAVTMHEESKVYGELYRVDNEMLDRLDALECYHGPRDEANLYERIEQTVHTDQETYAAKLYIYPEPPVHGQLIRSGDWLCEKVQEQERLLYFAYGSCMDDARFKSAGVDHLFTQMIGSGVLRDFELSFGFEASDGYGRADIVESEGHRVEGKIYEIGGEALAYLFIREGVSSEIYRPAIVQVEMDGALVANVLTFTVIDKLQNDVPPPDGYMDEIIRGAEGTVSNHYFDELLVRFQKFRHRHAERAFSGQTDVK